MSLAQYKVLWMYLYMYTCCYLFHHCLQNLPLQLLHQNLLSSQVVYIHAVLILLVKLGIWWSILCKHMILHTQPILSIIPDISNFTIESILSGAHDTTPVWKGPQLYHENAWITADYPRISTSDIRGYSQEILCSSSPWHTAEIRGCTIHTVINSWRRWQARTARKQYLISADRAAHCVLRYESALSCS